MQLRRSSTCLYGRSGSGKTGRIGDFLDTIREIEGNPKAKARLYSAEDYETLEHRIKSEDVKDGDIELCRITIRDHPFDTLKNVAFGFWPKDPDDPKSDWLPPTPETFQTYRAFFYEGLHSMAEYVMGSYAIGGLADLAGKGARTGPGARPGEDTVQFNDGRIKVGGNSRSHYNVGQKWLHAAVVWSERLPVHVVWTAHETAAKNEKTLKIVVGPEVVGDAATPHVPQWFGSTHHFVVIPTKTGLEYRIYLKDHYDPERPDAPCISQIRLPVDVLDEPRIVALLNQLPEYAVNRSGVFKKILLAKSQIKALAREIIREKTGGL